MTGVLQETRHLAAMLGLAVALSFRVSTTWAARQACTPGIITRVGATTLNRTSRSPSLSQTGPSWAFESRAPDLDGDITLDVFVYDRALCTFELVSASSSSTKGNSSSQQASISGDRQCALFESPANNLVPSDVNASFDVFVRDRLLGLTTLVSVNSAGVQPAAGGSVDPEISGNGQFVAFISDATALVSGDTNNEHDPLRPGPGQRHNGARVDFHGRRPGRRPVRHRRRVPCHLAGRTLRRLRVIDERAGGERFQPRV